MKHGHPGLQVPNELHIVLNDQHRVISRQGFEQIRRAFGFRVTETGNGLIHQQQLGILNHQHANLQPLFLSVGEGPGPMPGAGRQIDDLQQTLDALPLGTGETASQHTQGSFWRTHRQGQVLLHTQLFKHPWALKLATNAQTGNLVFVAPQQGATLKAHVTCLGTHLAGDHIQKSGLPCSVRANHSP